MPLREPYFLLAGALAAVLAGALAAVLAAGLAAIFFAAGISMSLRRHLVGSGGQPLRESIGGVRRTKRRSTANFKKIFARAAADHSTAHGVNASSISTRHFTLPPALMNSSV